MTVFKRQRQHVENQVAFYASFVAHDIQHLGQLQALIFDNVRENIGHGYNNMSGHFTAPVSGTYVFHVTLCSYKMGVSGEFFAFLYVNNEPMARFLATQPYQQSSQMLVITLKANDIVVVKSSVLDQGYIGHAFSSFSGFLLYENDSLEIVG